MRKTIDVKTLTLVITQYQAAQMFDWPFSESPKVEVDHIKHMTAHMVHMIQRVATQREVVAEYPADWWQALKDRFAPTWACRLWPVLRKRIDMEVMYPKIALPQHGHVVTLHTCDVSLANLDFDE